MTRVPKLPWNCTLGVLGLLSCVLCLGSLDDVNLRKACLKYVLHCMLHFFLHFFYIWSYRLARLIYQYSYLHFVEDFRLLFYGQTSLLIDNDININIIPLLTISISISSHWWCYWYQYHLTVTISISISSHCWKYQENYSLSEKAPLVFLYKE